MRHIGIHNDNEISFGEGHSIDIGRAETELFFAFLDQDAFLAVDFLQILGYIIRAVGAVVVDDHDLEVVFGVRHVLHDEPDDYRKVVFLIVGRQDYGINVWLDFELH